MRLPSVMRRRPSAALIISCVALFVALGGAGYAAVSIPNNSVGTAQLRKNAVTNSKIANNAVSFRKIQPNAVGRVRANTGQLQERVGKTCAAGSAIGAIARGGTVTCNPTIPAESSSTVTDKAIPAPTTSTPPTGTPPTTGAPSTPTPTQVTSLTLAAGSQYLLLANPTATVTPSAAANQRVLVACTLSVGNTTTTRQLTVLTRTTADPVFGSIPLQLTAGSGSATLSCSANPQVGAPTTTVSATLTAVQVAPAG